MIIDERMVTYINSLDTGHTPFLENLERTAKQTKVPIIRREMQSFLKVFLKMKQPKRIPDYEKNKDCFDVLKPLQAGAIQRAKARTEQVRSQGIEPISRQSNPLTTVWELVEYLNSKI